MCTLRHISNEGTCTAGRIYGGRPIKDYNADYMRQESSKLSPKSSMRSSLSDFTDTTVSTWNQRHQPPTAEYPSVLSDRLKIDRIERINTFQRRLDYDTSNLNPRDPGPSFLDNNYRTERQIYMESLSDQLTKVLSTGAGSSHINGSLADSGIQTDNTSTSVPQIYVADASNTTQVVFAPKILKDAAVDTRNENNLQDIPFIDDEDEEKSKRRPPLNEKHKSMSNIPERIEEISSKEQSNERLSSSYNRAKSPTFVERFKKFFSDIGFVRASDTAINTNSNTFPKTLQDSYRQTHARSESPIRTEARESSTLPKDMRFRKAKSSQTVFIKHSSPANKDHVSVVQINGNEKDNDSSSETFIKEVVYIKSIESNVYPSKETGSTIIVVPPPD